MPDSRTITEPGADAESAAIADLGHPYRWIILLVLVAAAIMEILDTTIINVAIPNIAAKLDARTEAIAWVSTGYILSNVIVLPMTAWLSGRFGRKICLGGSVLLFIAASLLCGRSHRLSELVFWRIVQGAGGAALISTAQATPVEIFPKSKLGMVQAIFGMGLLVAPTVGPSLGAWIIGHYSWSWCFVINIPIGLISAVIISAYLPNTRQAQSKSGIDWAGIGLPAVGLGSLQYVLSDGRRLGLFGSIVSLIAFAVWDLRSANTRPIANLRVLRSRSLVAGSIIGVALGVGLYAAVFLYPFLPKECLASCPARPAACSFPAESPAGWA